MKQKSSVTVKITAGVKGYSPEAVRYAAYSLTDRAYVSIEPSGNNGFSVTFTPKEGARAKDLSAVFRQALADEKLREKNFTDNRELREFLILKAISGEQPAPEAADSDLSPEQEKELDDLIAQVEKEIREESASGSRDPLGITKTWEEKHAAGPKRKKK